MVKIILLLGFFLFIRDLEIGSSGLQSRLSDLFISLFPARKSPVEMTIQKLGKNNIEISPLNSSLLTVKIE